MSEPSARPLVGCLTIAGSDSGGGAGIQADIKTFSALNCYATSAITAVTAQDTSHVHSIVLIPPADVGSQIDAVLNDTLNIKAIKVGMLGSADVVAVVAARIQVPRRPENVAPSIVVVDPVMIAKGGASLAGDATVDAMKRVLLPLATLVTPNIPEAERLTGRTVTDLPSMLACGNALLEQVPGLQAVLMKGGHADFMARAVDVLLQRGQEPKYFAMPWVASKNSHGTGCTLSAAIAAKLALGLPLHLAVEEAKNYVYRCMRANVSRSYSGHGPLHHFTDLWPTTDATPFWAEIENSAPLLCDRLYDHSFNIAAAKGQLAPSVFRRYLLQDEIYLREFGKSTGMLVDLARTDRERQLANKLMDAINGECDFHTTFNITQDDVDSATPLPACARYLEYLRRHQASKDFATVAGSVMPCFYTYWAIAERMNTRFPIESFTGRYGDVRKWVEFYRSPVSEGAAKAAEALLNEVAASSDAAARQALREVIVEAVELEVGFFDMSCELRVAIYPELPDVHSDRLHALVTRLTEEAWSVGGVNVAIETIALDRLYNPAQFDSIFAEFDVVEIDGLFLGTVLDRRLALPWPADVFSGEWSLSPDALAWVSPYGVPHWVCAVFFARHSDAGAAAATFPELLEQLDASGHSIADPWSLIQSKAFLSCAAAAIDPDVTDFKPSDDTKRLFALLAKLVSRSRSDPSTVAWTMGYSEAISQCAREVLDVKPIHFGVEGKNPQRLFIDVVLCSVRAPEQSSRFQAATAFVKTFVSESCQSWMAQGRDAVPAKHRQLLTTRPGAVSSDANPADELAQRFHAIARTLEPLRNESKRLLEARARIAQSVLPPTPPHD